jgi:UDP-N-acetylmuramate dehydrogenase
VRARVLPAEKLTTIALGSPRLVYIPETLTELRSLLKENLPVIGGGSNTVLSDESGKPLISLSGFKKIEISGSFLTAGAGVRLREVLRLQLKHKFSLFEFLAGVPRATVGGLIAQNAGAYGQEVKAKLVEVKFLSLDSLELEVLRDFSSFGYRDSPFPKAGAVVEATFRILPLPEAKKAVSGFVRKRLSSQPPFHLKTCGCVFKNPPGESAGRLLDIAGLKGFRVGGVRFSEKHANFVLNEGGTFDDFRRLLEIATEKVAKLFGVELSVEVKVV